jgi:excisionase family DNA binding protein
MIAETEVDREADSLTYTVPEAARKLGISRNLAFDLVRRGELPAVRLGRRLVVSRKALDLLLLGNSA